MVGQEVHSLHHPATVPHIEEDDWCHIQETISMLYLAVCQIETSVVESTNSVEQLSKSFTELASHTRQVEEQAQALCRLEQLGTFKELLSNNTQEMQTKISEAITAFQFYDRISQRLDHVALSLGKLTEVLGAADKMHDPLAWKQIQGEVKASYSMEAERIMFEHIMRGASVKEALEIYQHHFNEQQADEDDDVELF